jgi:hypothetical protein
MCIMAILYRSARNAHILLASNREELSTRPTQHPKIQSGTPRVICGTDLVANGTWLGVNQFGLFAAVSNRRKLQVPSQPRSRGLLCRDLLQFRQAKDAAEHAAKELATGRYAGANYVCADSRFAAVVHGGNRVEIVELQPGLHIISGGDVDQPGDERDEAVRRMLTLHKLDSAVTFLAVASRAFSRPPDTFGRRGIVVTGTEPCTVSSTLLAISRKIQQCTFQYSPGPPGIHSYEDLSALLRQVLSTSRNKNRDGEEAVAIAGKTLVKSAKKPQISKK